MKLIPFAIVLLFYSKVILTGGVLIVDDWGDIANAVRHQSFSTILEEWFPLFSNRPVAAFAISTVTYLFKDGPIIYFALNLILYLFAIHVSTLTLARVISCSGNKYFILIASFPVISSVVLFSPVNQFVATLSVFLWSLSLWLLGIYLSNRKTILLLVSFFLILLALLTYEIILPLLLLSVFYPFLLNEKLNIKYIKRYLMPVLFALFLILIWQKVLAQLVFGKVYSRLSISGLSTFFELFKTWFKVFIYELPLLWYDSLKSIGRVSLVDYTLIGFMAAFFFFTHKRESISKKINPKAFKFGLIFLLVFLSSSALYLLSSASATIYGYDNRGLTSAWFCFSIVLAYGFSYSNYIIKGIAVVVLVVTVLAMSIIRDNYIESFQMQNQLLADIKAEINKVNVPFGSYIIGDVPYHVRRPFRGELVFSQPWDFGEALYIKTNGRISGGVPVNKAYFRDNHFKIDSNKIVYDGWLKLSINQLWIYHYSEMKKRFLLEKIKDNVELSRALLRLVN